MAYWRLVESCRVSWRRSLVRRVVASCVDREARPYASLGRHVIVPTWRYNPCTSVVEAADRRDTSKSNHRLDSNMRASPNNRALPRARDTRRQ